MLENEFQFFLKNQKELVKKYKEKYVVIIGEEVVGSYDTEEEAYQTTSKTHKLGTFLIQQCLSGNEGYTQTFNSRVIYV
ncbi:MAG: hypothetical protein A3K10_15695 [Bacteroidetes bacterium RIFCSPLOWO2_12_FULL_31_6]|nr:MAG: hypothetical protein A3K10_15695 [Bacteroidetes bacterium RIFCSPLOWO2_12_FULL_31_6]